MKQSQNEAPSISLPHPLRPHHISSNRSRRPRRQHPPLDRQNPHTPPRSQDQPPARASRSSGRSPRRTLHLKPKKNSHKPTSSNALGVLPKASTKSTSCVARTKDPIMTLRTSSGHVLAPYPPSSSSALPTSYVRATSLRRIRMCSRGAAVLSIDSCLRSWARRNMGRVARDCLMGIKVEG